uniref:Uncharacterized protein n=1 Tax=Arundo donax TaxID=35708 RepID=A0A0A8XQQ9_ARUDO
MNFQVSCCITKWKPVYAGNMDMYLQLVNFGKLNSLKFCCALSVRMGRSYPLK